MSEFSAVLIEHGYATSRYEREIIERAGGSFIDADSLPLEEALRLCEDADGILLRRLTVTRELLARFRRCKIIVRYGVGTDNIDVEAATQAGVYVVNVPGYCVDEVSDHAIALLLSAVRQIVPTHERMREGAWDVKRPHQVLRMRGRTLGIVGLGMIGRTVAAKLRPWGMRLLAVDPFVSQSDAEAAGVELVDLAELCRESDYITIHAPLLPETRHLFSREQFALMKQGALLVNTARGGLIDLPPLLEALDQGAPGIAALDVFELEPLPPDAAVRRHPKVILTDHMGWYSEQSQIELQETAAREIVRVCTGGLPCSLSNPQLIHTRNLMDRWTPGPSMRWQLERLGLPLPHALGGACASQFDNLLSGETTV